VTLDAVGALRDMGAGYRDQFLGFLVQAASGEHFAVEIKEGLHQIGFKLIHFGCFLDVLFAVEIIRHLVLQKYFVGVKHDLKVRF
jgi:hypothetical protein